MFRLVSRPFALSALVVVQGLVLCAPARAHDNVVVNNRCDSRVRLFVRAYDANGYDNYGWWVFAPHEEGQVLSQHDVRLIHDHSKRLFFFAEGIGNDLVWNDSGQSTSFEGETYKLAVTDNSDDDNDTPIILTCDK